MEYSICQNNQLIQRSTLIKWKLMKDTVFMFRFFCMLFFVLLVNDFFFIRAETSPMKRNRNI